MKKIFFLIILTIIISFQISGSSDSDNISRNIYNTVNRFIQKSNKLILLIKGYKKLPEKPVFEQLKIENNNYRIKIKEFENSILVDRTGKNIIEWEYDIINPERIESNENIPDFLFRDKPFYAAEIQPVILKAYADGSSIFSVGYDFKNVNNEIADDFFVIDDLQVLAENVKDQKNSPEQIKFLNSINNTKFFTMPEDTYEVAYKCYFYSVAHILDWYENKMSDKKNRKYKEFFNGKTKKGVDPRLLEILYRYRSKKENRFQLTPDIFVKDPVTKESISMSLKDAMLVFDDWEKVPEVIKDRYTDKIFFKKDFLNFMQFKRVREDFYCFNNIINWLKQKKPLIGGISLEKKGKDFRVSSHSVMIIGYLRYSDIDFLIYKDSYGEDKPIKMLPFFKFREIYGYDT